MAEDNTPTVTARRRKPSQTMRIRLDTARRLQALNSKAKARRAAAKLKDKQEDDANLKEQGSHAFDIAPRVPKIKKNKLSRPTPAEPKYRKRQKCKTWLPTHIYHAKRAHMATTKDPIWRFAIPLSPTEKSYRPTHRARGARGAVAWDMSYISTIQLEGTETAIQAVLAAMGVEGDAAWGRNGKKWRSGTRSLQAWTYEKDHHSRPIAPVTLLWCAKQEDIEMIDADHAPTKTVKKDHRKLWIRVHPSAFLQLWQDILDVSKKQTPPVMVEDLRFDIGSIEITGPGSTEALLATLKPVLGPECNVSPEGSPEAIWPSLLGVTNPASLPNNALLSFAVSDPRLHFPARTLHPPNSDSHMNDLATLLSAWSPDKTQGPSALFDRSTRLTAARQLPSQKAINRRRSLAGPGKYPPAQPSDPQIPVIVLANKPQARAKRSNAPGSWTILLPWKCVVPVWYSLMFYPLSSGGNPLLGGLKQQQQLAFEAGEAWFPGDFPGTRAGWEWYQRETRKSRNEWERRPKGRRPEFDNISLVKGQPKGEIGQGWACDWERLVQGPTQPDVTVQSSAPNIKADTGKKPAASESEADSTSSLTIPPLNIHNVRYPRVDTSQTLIKLDQASVDASALASVFISLISRGTPTPRARIYRLPTDPALRLKWLSLASKNPDKPAQQKPSGGKPAPASNEARRLLAESLLASPPEDSEPEHLDVPTEDDLIGFVTTGNYNLSEGKGTGIGSIQVSKVLALNVKPSEKRMCIIRATGETNGRLGTWEFV